MLLSIRLFIMAFVFVLAGTLGTFYCLLHPFNPKNTPFFAHIFSGIGIRVFNLELEYWNWEKRIARQPSIVICNHQSSVDLFTCGSVINGKTVSIGKKTILYIPFFGLLYWLAGNILIERKVPKKAMKIVEQSTKKALLERDTSIWIYPEGTRNPESRLLPFKRGAFQAAIKAQVPIMPICVSTYKGKINLNRWKSGKVIIDILDPIETSGLDPAESIDLADRCRGLMQDRLDKVNRALI